MRPKQSTVVLGRRLLEIAVYNESCRIGATLALDALAETEVGDWKMPDYRAACAYATSQGWLIVRDGAGGGLNERLNERLTERPSEARPNPRPKS